jgi:predicted deacylase
MPRRFILMFFAASFAGAADITVGTAMARSGQKTTGYIQVPAGVDAATNIPVILIGGAHPGPTLAIVAGAHGTEYASIIALENLARLIDPATLSGTLIILPLINLASFDQKVPHINPVDGKGMNAMYPGKPDGTQTERASWAIAKQVIAQCDYLIDLHGGDLDENLRRYSYWPQTGKSQLDKPSRGMVMAFGLDHIIIQKIQPPAPATASISRYAVDQGKPTIIAEAGHSGTTEAADIDSLVRGCTNVMRYLNLLPGTFIPVEHPVWLGPLTRVRSEDDGIFYALGVPEAYVERGMIVGYTTDYFGNKLADVKAPVTGVITFICSVPSMKKGNAVVVIGEIASAP